MNHLNLLTVNYSFRYFKRLTVTSNGWQTTWVIIYLNAWRSPFLMYWVRHSFIQTDLLTSCLNEQEIYFRICIPQSFPGRYTSLVLDDHRIARFHRRQNDKIRWDLGSLIVVFCKYSFLKFLQNYEHMSGLDSWFSWNVRTTFPSRHTTSF